MKKTALSLAIALLLFYSCSPAPADGGDGYIPVPGLSFGMSVEEALEAVPRLELVEVFTPSGSHLDYPDYPDGLPDDFFPDGFPESFRESLPPDFFTPGTTYFLLENTSAYGEPATIRLRFTNWHSAVIDDEEYTHNLGLHSVTIIFPQSVKTSDIMNQLEGLFDFEWEDDWEERYAGKVDLHSKNQNNNLDDETVKILRDYMTRFPVIHGLDGHQKFVDYSMVLDDAAQPRNSHNFRVVGSFDHNAQILYLDGFMAAILYKARQSAGAEEVSS